MKLIDVQIKPTSGEAAGYEATAIFQGTPVQRMGIERITAVGLTLTYSSPDWAGVIKWLEHLQAMVTDDVQIKTELYR